MALQDAAVHALQRAMDSAPLPCWTIWDGARLLVIVTPKPGWTNTASRRVEVYAEEIDLREAMRHPVAVIHGVCSRAAMPALTEEPR